MYSNKIILSRLRNLADTRYRDFQSGLIPSVDKSRVIGVRTPILRKFAQEMSCDGVANDFVSDLPHKFFEENQLHAFIISSFRDFDLAVTAVDEFLPFIDNWATCDQMSPRVFVKNADKLLPYIKRWIKSSHIYMVRFGVLCLMRYFLDDMFENKYADMVVNIKSDEYYINMMRAWYFATALAKQYDKILPIFENRQLDVWTHNRAIQKAIESFRVSDAHKQKLKLLKV